MSNEIKDHNDIYIEGAIRDIGIVKEALQDYAQTIGNPIKRVMEAFQRLVDELHRELKEKQEKIVRSYIMKNQITDSTIVAIKAYSTDENKGNSLEALMNEYGASRLIDITEEQGQAFLSKLENGEITV